MIANLKVKLYKGKTHADGTHPILLQFYMDGKKKRKNIYSCHEKDWDYKESRVKSKSSNASYINNLISEKYTEHERELLKILNGENNAKSFFTEKKTLTLDYVLEQECIRFKNENKPGSYDLLCCYRKEVAEFTESSTLNINEIDLEWFKKYAAYIYSEVTVNGKVTKKSNNGSSAQKKIKTIRRAIEIYSGKVFSIEIKEYRQKIKKPVKQKLTAEELSRIEDLELKPGSLIDSVRDIFLMQVYLRGARVGSILMAYSEQFSDGRYTAENGLGKNNVGSRLIPRAQGIVNKYFGKYERLFPLFKFATDKNLSEFENSTIAHNHKKSCTTVINKYLKEIAKKAGINKPLSSHIARHTFARMAIDKINNPMVTMDLLGHRSLAVHQQYLNDIRKDDVLDAAADDIFS